MENYNDLKKENEVLSKMITIILGVPSGIIIVIMNCLLDGFVFMKIYNWYLVKIPAFSIIDFKTAVGAIVLIAFIRYNPNRQDTKERTTSESFKLIINPFLMSLVSLLLAYLLKIFL